MGTLQPHIHVYIREQRAKGRLTGTSPVGVRNRLHLFARFHGNRPLAKVTERQVLAWLATLEDRSPATRRAYLASLRCFTAWLHQHGELAADPCKDIPPMRRPRRVPRALPHDAIVACFTACRDDRDRAVVALAVGCGLRRAEIASVRWEDYDAATATLRVRGKGDAERVVPVPVFVQTYLEAVRGRQYGPIVAPMDGSVQPLRPDTIGAMCARILRDAGVKRAAFDGVATHAFRHTCASDVLDHAHGDLRPVQQMLGHSELSSTSIYLRVAGLGQVRDAMEGRDYAA